MQKEDLIKRMRLFVTLTTMAFIVLVVGLLVQFGFIAYYHGRMTELREDNARMQQELEDLKKDGPYYGAGGEGSADGDLTGGGN